MSSVNAISHHAPAAERADRTPKFPLGAPIVIAGVSAILALATASECSSVTHIGSLVYGAVLWGWWGCLAGLLWKLAPRYPSLVRFSPVAIAIHLVVASTLAIVHLIALWGLGFPFGWHAGATADSTWQALINPNR